MEISATLSRSATGKQPLPSECCRDHPSSQCSHRRRLEVRATGRTDEGKLLAARLRGARVNLHNIPAGQSIPPPLYVAVVKGYHVTVYSSKFNVGFCIFQKTFQNSAVRGYVRAGHPRRGIEYIGCLLRLCWQFEEKACMGQRWREPCASRVVSSAGYIGTRAGPSCRPRGWRGYCAGRPPLCRRSPVKHNER